MHTYLEILMKMSLNNKYLNIKTYIYHIKRKVIITSTYKYGSNIFHKQM